MFLGRHTCTSTFSGFLLCSLFFLACSMFSCNAISFNAAMFACSLLHSLVACTLWCFWARTFVPLLYACTLLPSRWVFLGHATMLLVPMHALCYVLGHALSLTLPDFSLLARALWFSRPFPLRTHFLFVWGTHSSSSSFACTLPTSRSFFPCSPRSHTPMSKRVVLMHTCHYFILNVATSCYFSLLLSLCIHGTCSLPIYSLGRGRLVLGGAQE